jgi:protein involved in polysaccharide export with SLBB domain
MCASGLFAQDGKEKIGLEDLKITGANYYNYSDKDKVNIEVNLWGYVRNPGKYLIPKGTTFLDLITLGGGPVQDSKLEDVRLIRPKNDTLRVSEDQIMTLNYNDYLWGEKIAPGKINPVLKTGDIVLVPGSPRYFFRDNLSFILSISSVLISLGILVLTISRNN